MMKKRLPEKGSLFYAFTYYLFFATKGFYIFYSDISFGED